MRTGRFWHVAAHAHAARSLLSPAFMRLLFLIASTILFAACSTGSDSTTSGRLDDMGGHLTEIQTGTAEHAARVASLAEVSELPPEEQVHFGEVGEHFGAMEADMGHMGMCMHETSGEPPDMGAMEELLAQMRAECSTHQAVMGSADDMSMAGDEEMRHGQAMEEHVDAMNEMREAMMDESGEFDCPGGMGM